MDDVQSENVLVGVVAGAIALAVLLSLCVICSLIVVGGNLIQLPGT